MKTWVLLRGLGRDKRHFGEFLTQFKQAFSNDKVLTIDTLGNGDFRNQQSPIDISQYTDHCRQMLCQIHNHHPIEIVALSLGGMVAMDWANRYPAQVNSLTLMNTSAANLTPAYRRIKLTTLARLLYAFIINRKPKTIETAIIKATSNQSTDKINNHTINQWTDIRQNGITTASNMIKQLIAAAKYRVAPIHSKFASQFANRLTNNNILILASKQDNIVNHQASQDLQHFFNCPMQIHPSAGHDLPLDDPQWVIKQIKQHHQQLTQSQHS